MRGALAQIDGSIRQVNALCTRVDDDRLLGQARAAGRAPGGWHWRRRTASRSSSRREGPGALPVRTTYGSPIYRDNTPAEDALLVEALEAPRAPSSSGSQNTPEFGAGSQTFNVDIRRDEGIRYDLTRTCGGSSSGAAAVAVACGMTAARRRQRPRRIAAQSGELLQRRRVPAIDWRVCRPGRNRSRGRR